MRANFSYERANFRPERADLGPEREDYRSERPRGGRINGRTDKFPCPTRRRLFCGCLKKKLKI